MKENIKFWLKIMSLAFIISTLLAIFLLKNALNNRESPINFIVNDKIIEWIRCYSVKDNPLYAICENDVFGKFACGKIYSFEDLAKCISDAEKSYENLE